MVSKTGKNIETCWMCGAEVEVARKTNTHFVCQMCKAKMKISRQEKMIERATKKYIKSRHHLLSQEKIDKIVNIVWKQARKNGFYDSADEVMVALQLAYEGVWFKNQVKVGGHRVDFILPDMHVAVEVDGEIYHADTEKTQRENERIKEHLGDDWEVIRIPTKEVEDYLDLGIEKAILMKLEEEEHYKIHGFDENDEFWTDEGFEKRYLSLD